MYQVSIQTSISISSFTGPLPMLPHSSTTKSSTNFQPAIASTVSLSLTIPASWNQYVRTVLRFGVDAFAFTMSLLTASKADLTAGFIGAIFSLVTLEFAQVTNGRFGAIGRVVANVVASVTSLVRVPRKDVEKIIRHQLQGVVQINVVRLQRTHGLVLVDE